ncbi:copper chaperone PCu(A)C [Pseudogemmobacter sp. W21_MBD1_M6]|uniref:copper chaperone PCu(A)C n=1 Tax=Pseudogemmobacter sp. W21_MBD1_M6 TaxID=3240271 RepID=UPI003F9D2A51
MSFMKTLAAAAVLLTFALPAFAHDGLKITDAYARSSGPSAKSGAAFMVIENHTEADDRLIGASTTAAKLVELHTHKETGDGVMQMLRVDEGFAIPAKGEHALARGGDHVMLMGLTAPMAQGDIITVTLTFEKAGEMIVEVPVDLQREDMPAMPMNHGTGHGTGHGAMQAMPSN